MVASHERPALVPARLRAAARLRAGRSTRAAARHGDADRQRRKSAGTRVEPAVEHDYGHRDADGGRWPSAPEP
jgi:hypothetical protein